MPLTPIPSEIPAREPQERLFIRTSGFGECPIPPKDHAYFLRMLDTDLPDAWIAGLKQNGGYELLHGLAGVGARVSAAISAWSCGTIAGDAAAGAKAEGFIYLFRQSAAAGAGVVKAGTIVGTGDKRKFRTREDAAFGSTDLGPIAVSIEAVLQGSEYDVDGETNVAFGDAIPGQITEIFVLREDPDFWDDSIQVRQVGAMESGSNAFIEQLGLDRNVSLRGPGEGEDEYRLRVKSIVDSVCPAGIERSITEYIRRWSPFFSCAIIDAWDWEYQTAYDCFDTDAPNFPQTLFLYDDPRPPGPRNRWLSLEDANGGGFIVVMPRLPCLKSFAMILNDPAMDAAQHLTPNTDGGRRAYNVLSLPRNLPPEILPAVLSGPDTARDALYAGAYDLANELKAAGTSLSMLIEDAE